MGGNGATLPALLRAAQDALAAARNVDALFVPSSGEIQDGSIWYSEAAKHDRIVGFKQQAVKVILELPHSLGEG